MTQSFKSPQQARSIESMNRMLDAAEALLSEGGPDALTVDAVVRRSGVSNGSLYARFGDRLGLLAAVQDRFLRRLEETTHLHMRAASEFDDLNGVLRHVATMFYDGFVGNRSAFDAFMLQTLAIPGFRERGSQAAQITSRALTQALLKRSAEITHDEPSLACDFVFRSLFALATQAVMFDAAESTGNSLDRSTWIDETTLMLHAYLTR